MSDKLYTPIQMKVLSAEPSSIPPTGYAYLYPTSAGMALKLDTGTVLTLAEAPTSLSDIDSNIFGQVSWTTVDIDWSDERVRDKTLSAGETWTFSNLKAGKTISVYVTGDYSITLPSLVTTINGTYDGTVNNLIVFHCIDDTSGAEKVVCQIFNL